MLEQLIRKPTTFVTAVWIFQFVSLDIGHRHRKQNCYQRAFATPTKLDVIVDQAKTEAKKSPNYKDLSLRALPRPRMNAKGAFTSFGQNAQLPYTVTKVCWFLMESFLMEIKSAAKFCTRHLLLEPKQCESAWDISLRWVDYVSVPLKSGGVGLYTQLNIL